MLSGILNKIGLYAKNQTGNRARNTVVLRKDEKDKWLDATTFKAWLDRYNSHF